MRQRVVAAQAQLAGRGVVAGGDTGAARRRRQHVAGRKAAGDRHSLEMRFVLSGSLTVVPDDNVVAVPPAV